MPQKQNALIKCVSLYSLSFDNPLTTSPARGERGRSSSQDVLYPLSFDNSPQTAPSACERSSSRALSACSYSQDSSRNLDSYDGIFHIFHLDFNYGTFI